MPGAQSRSASGLASAQAGGRGRRARPKAAHGNAAGAEHCLQISGALMSACKSHSWRCASLFQQSDLVLSRMPLSILSWV